MMMMNTSRFIFPPRTELACEMDNNDSLKMFLAFDDVIGQLKLNGSRICIYISPTNKIEAWDRHKKNVSHYLTQGMKDEISSLNYPKGKWNVFDGELLQLKNSAKQFKERIVLFDTLVWDSQWLIDETYLNRYNLLSQLIKPLRIFDVDIKVGGYHILTLKNYGKDELTNTWTNVIKKHDIVEGFVLKRTGYFSRLERGNSVINNSHWMLRVRKATKNHR